MRLSNKPPADAGRSADETERAAEPAPADAPEASATPTDAPVGAAIEPAEAAAQSWSATFPHMEIDELINRVAASSTLSAGDVTALLGAIVDEARRLRSTVVRLTAEKLAAAESEAEEILSSARREAAELRQKANAAMVSRLNEADSASSAVLHAAQVDAKRRSRQGQQLLAKTRVEVEDLRSRVAAIFDSTNGILPLLTDAASSLGRMESEVGASADPAPAPLVAEAAQHQSLDTADANGAGQGADAQAEQLAAEREKSRV